MTTPAKKIILIGAGNIAQAHVDAFRLAGADVVGVCTRSNAGQTFAETNAIPHFRQSISELIDHTQPNGVVILTQPSSYQAVLEALKPYNLPVLVEKPFGLSSNQGEALKKHLPTLAMMAHNRRFYGHVRTLAKELKKDTVAPMVATLILPEREKDVIHRDEQTRNAWPMLNHIHGIDLCRYLTGEATDWHNHHTMGTLSFSNNPRYTCATYTTNRGHIVNFISNLDSPGGWRLHLLGEKHEISLNPFETGQRKTMAGIEPIQPVNDADTKTKPGFLAQAECFLQGITTPNILPDEWVTVDDALVSMKLVEKLYLSTQNN
jgi:predicted dehydrogenase